MKLKEIMLAVAALALANAALAAVPNNIYIVQLSDEPVASYAGTVSGLAATRPAAGKKIDFSAKAVASYESYLQTKRSAMLAQAGNPKAVHQYSTAFNGFSAQLTDAQVKQLEATPGVARVSAAKTYQLSTNYTPIDLALSTPGGAWSHLDAASRALKGEDVIIGDIDTGISPENLAFADRVDANGKPTFSTSGTLAYGPPPAKWKGICQTGPSFNASDCNNKLIGARYFFGWLDYLGGVIPSTDIPSPRGNASHGTHTGSTSAGNSNVKGQMQGWNENEPVAYAGVTSGMAPRARLAVYKACWIYTSCSEVDTLAAVEAAVQDGVDIINFSISGTWDDPSEPMQLAFLNASSAGIFVAAAAANSGPARSVNNIAPWITTVAADTHGRKDIATATLGNGQSFVGRARPAEAAITAPLVMAAALALPGKTVASDCSDLANAGSTKVWDPSKLTGKVVVCDRNPNRAAYLTAWDVANGGAAGALFLETAATTTPEPLINEYYSATNLYRSRYMTVKLAERGAVLAYAATANPTVTLSASRYAEGADKPIAPVMASFSSRGPSYSDLDIMKPDIAAPGVNVFAGADWRGTTQAERDGLNDGSFRPPVGVGGMLSGTSMATPHIAGLAALVKQAHPGWSPAAIKSALMTSTSKVLLDDGSTDPDRWGYGAGHVNPTAALETDLYYDISTDDYKRYLCSTGLGAYTATSSTCLTLGSVPGYNLNLPSLTASIARTSRTFTRTITNGGAATAQYVATASVPGFAVQVQPASMALAPGANQTFTVTATATTVPDDVWQFGSLVWSNGVKQVTSPISLMVKRITAPTTLSDKRLTGTKAFTAAFSFNGSLATSTAGPTKPTKYPLTTAQGELTCMQVPVPTGTRLMKLAIYADEVPAGTDLDLWLYNPNVDGWTTTPLGASQSAGSTESFTVLSPQSVGYQVCVYGYNVPSGPVTYNLSAWLLGPNSPKNGTLTSVAPKTVKMGTQGSVAMGWSGISSTERSLAYLDWVGTDTASGVTFNAAITPLVLDPVTLGTLSTGITADAAGLQTTPKSSSTSKASFGKSGTFITPNSK